MDSFIDERDRRLLDNDKYTFFVMRRVIDGKCRLLLTDHTELMLCYTESPYPVWIWTPDNASDWIMENAYRLAEEHSLLQSGQRFNVKYDLAEHFVKRAAESGRKITISTNMLAYDCPEPVKPDAQADGSIYSCTDKDTDELAEIISLFHKEIGADEEDMSAYRERAKDFISAGNMFFWKNSDGITAASCKYTPLDDMASVNLVYTRPEHRRKRYAENLVYKVTELAAQAGFTPMLYTDADYAASNACYRKIGYIQRGKLCTLTVS